jgi:alpha-L-fucosidase
VFDWPEDGRLVVPGLKARVLRARVSNGATLPVKPNRDGVELQLPARRPAGLIPVLEVETAGSLEPNREVYVLKGHENSLDSGGAKLAGCKPVQVQWMEKFGDWKHAECAAQWAGAGSEAVWAFRTTEPGEYYADVEYTLPAEDDYSEWKLTLDGKAVTFPLIDTGERAKRTAFGGALPRFREYRVGRIRVETAGTHELKLGPTGDAGKGARIAGVRLRPVGRD